MPATKKKDGSPTLLAEAQGDLLEKSYEESRQLKDGQPVECLGQIFPNDAARRDHFLTLLAEKLKDPQFRKIEGFPIGSDEDILALSDPPYYTACPNPWLGEFVKFYGTPYDPRQPYHREPFTADVSEGKTHPIYNAHSNHTKVPHRAIMKYILHYTQPGDLVFDGFCGTGMTGVAAHLCGDRAEVQELGYQVQSDGTILNEEGKAFSKLGARRALLNDLSPVACFISHNYNTPVDVAGFEAKAKQVLDEVETEMGWMYTTLVGASSSEVDLVAQALRKCKSAEDCHSLLGNVTDLKAALGISKARFTLGTIDYVVWSDVFICPECGAEVVFWEVAVNKHEGTVEKEFNCPQCSARLTKRGVERAITKIFDQSLSHIIGQAKQVPVLVSYAVGRSGRQKKIDNFDNTLVEVIEKLPCTDWIPAVRMPAGDEGRRNDDSGLTHVHHFYTARNLRLLSRLRSKCARDQQLLLLFNSQLVNISRLNRYRPGVSFPYNPLSGTLYVGSQVSESNIFDAYRNKVKKLATAFAYTGGQKAVSTGSSVAVTLPDECVDYVFTDPPFGGNLTYGALSSLWEGWLGVMTDIQKEAITNNKLGRGLPDYHAIMSQCFREFFRMLKPGRWMTVEFSNTQASVWNSIQTALQEAGAVVANVSALDKQMGSFKAVTTATAVKQDLIISAYKPNGGLEERFAKCATQEQGVWEFVRSHLGYLPVVKVNAGQIEFIAERDPRIIYDRMVAFYFQHGLTVPLNSAEFQAGLSQRFMSRDGMVFLPSQALEYDRQKLQAKGVGQRTLLVDDERSCIDWLTDFLKTKPSDYSEIQPEFFTQLKGSTWRKGEKLPELSQLLKLNFLCYDGTGNIPAQIAAWLSKSETARKLIEKDATKLGSGDLETENSELKSRAKDRWYVPDPSRAVDLEKLRERDLLQEFDGYRASKDKRIKEFRIEAVRAGFKKGWQEKDYTTIIAVGRKLDEVVIQEDSKLLMWYTNALNRAGVEE